MHSNESKEEVTFDDILVTSLFQPDGNPVCGELESSTVNEDRNVLLNRLFNHMKDVLERAVRFAKQGLGNDEYKNHMFRVTCNEFFAYTKSPLSMHEFQALMQKIMNMAKEYHQNVLLLFSSFAVLTPDGLVMNVSPHIQCGKNPNLKLIVKNNPSSKDHVFKSVNQNGLIKPLLNACVDTNEVKQYGITIDNIAHHFSYDNVVRCKTAGGVDFYSCWDICRDHLLGVAKKNLQRHYNEDFPQADKEKPHTVLCSHVVSSNWIPKLYEQHCIGPHVIFCDPTAVTEHKDFLPIDQVYFGTGYDIRPIGQIKAHRFTNHVLPLVQMIYQDKDVNPFLDKFKRDLDVNFPSKECASPLTAALFRGNLTLAKRLISEFNASCDDAFQFVIDLEHPDDLFFKTAMQLTEFQDVVSLLPVLSYGNVNLAKKLVNEFKVDCESAWQYFIQSKNPRDTFFHTAMQLPQFRNKVDIHLLAEKNLPKQLCMALASGLEFKLDATRINKKANDQCAYLLVEFNKIKEVAGKNSFQINLDQHLPEQIRQFLIKQKGFSFMSKKELNSKEQVFFLEISKNPENALQIVSRAIQNELLKRVESGIKDNSFLEKLLSIQKELMVKNVHLSLDKKVSGP